MVAACYVPRSNMPPSSPYRMNSYRRQNLLVKRLALTLTHERQRHGASASATPSASAASAGAASKLSTSSARKRPFCNITSPDATESSLKPYKIKSDPNAGSANNDRDGDIVEIIDEYETWLEVSKIIPSLPYREESNALLSALLGVGNNIDGGNEIDLGATNTSKNEILHQSHSRYAISNLARALERMLHARNVMKQGRHRHSNYISSVSEQKPIKKEHAPVATDQKGRIEILPWNVILRISIRMAAFVANQLLQPPPSEVSVSTVHSNESVCLSANNLGFKSSSASASAKKSTTVTTCNDGCDADISGFHASVLHSILHVMDIALADLRVLSRMQSQHRQDDTSSTKSMDETTIPTTPMAHKHLPLQDQSIQRHQMLPIDRMFHDWKGHSSMQAKSGREVWGPSRYAFSTDIDMITNMIGVTNENGEGGRGGRSNMGINVEEWNGRVNALFALFDECIRAEEGYSEQNPLQQPQTQFVISPPKLRYGTKICSPSKSPSMASITRAHIERVGSRIKSDMNSGRKGSILSFNVHYPDSNVTSVNLQAVLNEERNIQSATSDETDELEETYRMSMAVGSSRRGDNIRESIERRLEILVQTLYDDKYRAANTCTGVNIDGAGAYLESLLRTLIQPSDPKVWMRLLEESNGKETPIMLRRGRTLLVSFLVGIQAPGWKDASHRLEPSPVPSYLGYLSARDDFEASRASENTQQHIMMNRSSYFLPAVERGQITIPPSPIVTEVGLSLCMKNFLQKDTPERLAGSSPYKPLCSSSTGANRFRKYGPLQFSESSRDQALVSIQSPLPNVNELTSDLLDLILRLAANDDREQGDMSIPLQLLVPSTSQSLTILLQAVTDHLDWLSLISISSRYRYILQHIIHTHQRNEAGSLHDIRTDDWHYPDDEGFSVWTRRASFVIDNTAVESRSRIALSTTQLMALLCSRTYNKKKGVSFPLSSSNTQLRQSSHFWNEIDKNSVNIPSNIMARILDLSFAVKHLLPLSYQCTLLLAASSLPSRHIKNPPATIQGREALPSLVATLCSMLGVLAKYEVLHDCIHVGWAIQMFALSISYFVFGEDFHSRERESKTLTDCDSAGDTIWEHLSCELNRLYCTVWGKDWQMCSRSPVSAKKCVYYESIGRGGNRVAMLVLMPSFDVFIATLIEFSCRLHHSFESDGVKEFCQFVANILFERYAYVHKVCSYPKTGYYEVDYPRQHEFSLIIGWIDAISSKLQDMICHRLFSGSYVNKKYGKVEEASTAKALHDLMTPMLKFLHEHIMRRVLLSTAPRPQITGDSPELVASAFVRLYKHESEKFLTKPSPAKTRKWNIYRQCLEKVFTLTTPDVLFACPGCPTLNDNAADTLTNIWNIYGECNLSHSVSIMVAASLHVDACTACPTQQDSTLVRKDDLMLQTKQFYNTFSSCAKSCILSSLHANDEFKRNINYLVRFVRRDLSLRGGTDIALEWWNEISVDVLTLLKNSTTSHS
jgi:hypothetical protein